MPNIINTKVVILWQHELITAARMLRKLLQPDWTKEDAENAMKACWAAIGSEELASGECPVTVMSCPEIEMITKTEVVSQ